MNQPLTAQAVFDRVWHHFITERKPRSLIIRDGVTICRYRDNNGNACAFGLFIPDCAYSTKMEERLIGDLLEDYPDLVSQFDKQVLEQTDNPELGNSSGITLLEALQIAHDDHSLFDSMRLAFERVAEDFHLKVPS